MSIHYTCVCGSSYRVPNNLQGQNVRCPKCGATGRVGNAISSAPGSAASTSQDLLHSRHKFLLQERGGTPLNKYSICDEEGRELLYVESPTRKLASIMAAMAAGLVAVGMVGGLIATHQYFFHAIDKILAGSVAAGLALATLFIVFIQLRPVRSVEVYTDLTKSIPIFFIRRTRAKFFPVKIYNIEDPDGRLVAILKNNYLLNVFGKRWAVVRPGGGKWAVARKRQTKYVISKFGTNEELGNYDRKNIFFGRCLLDMSSDTSYELDRRVALGLGIILDSDANF